MEKLIRNAWQRDPARPLVRATILRADDAPEGIDVERLRFEEAGACTLATDQAHVLSVLQGRANLLLDGAAWATVQPGMHVYLPSGSRASIVDDAGGLQLVHLSSAHARGTAPIVRDEQFVHACASPPRTSGSGEAHARSLRWILTPQYLSRRVFLHHDAALLSKRGDPVSWFHTTMFDVEGLPTNDEGLPVFKMSYNSRTEFNVCYEVTGPARVRMALHPYATGAAQSWGPWLDLDGDSTYHLNEAADGPERELVWDAEAKLHKVYRNKHEVYARDGHVSLFCLFDPAPTGVERHRPGEYSDYEPLADVIATAEYEQHRAAMAELDAMMDQLSLAKARGELEQQKGTPAWAVYESGRNAQRTVERRLFEQLSQESPVRARLLTRWLSAS